jgi:DNA-binding NtrC family response regulator
MSTTTDGGGTQSPRVLIVDDEGLIRWALSQALLERGCTIVEAADARSARHALETSGAREFDVVLLDYRLPDSQDLALLAHVRAASAKSRVVMMTADMSPDTIADAHRLGAVTVLPKPIDLGVVCAIVMKDEAPREGAVVRSTTSRAEPRPR